MLCGELGGVSIHLLPVIACLGLLGLLRLLHCTPHTTHTDTHTSLPLHWRPKDTASRAPSTCLPSETRFRLLTLFVGADIGDESLLEVGCSGLGCHSLIVAGVPRVEGLGGLLRAVVLAAAARGLVRRHVGAAVGPRRVVLLVAPAARVRPLPIHTPTQQPHVSDRTAQRHSDDV